mgnify:CR=1 FL=1
MSLLDEVIEAQTHDAFVDSHGSFSLSLAEAWRKMGQSAASHPLQWIVTGLQSFCAAHAQAVYLVHKNAEIWLVAHQCQMELSPQEFLTLSAENLLSQTPGGLLGRSLASLMAQEPQRLLLAHWSEPRRSPEAADFVTGGKAPRINPLLPSSGSALAVYAYCSTKIPELGSLLGYLLQYCHIPVHYVAHGLLLKSDTDVRSLHWIQRTPACPLYAKGEQTSVTTPLLIDFYVGTSAPQLLLKPPGGDDLSCYADWLEAQGDLEWLRNPGLTDATSCSGRYFQGPTQPAQLLRYWGSRAMGNSGLSERGQRSLSILTCGGDFILMVESQPGPDRILPIMYGTTLMCLEGQLKIPGVVVVAGANGLACDLGGMKLINDQRLQVWVEELRTRVREALQKAVNQPPVARARRSLWKTLGATTLAAAAAMCLDGVQVQDLVTTLQVGTFGGALLHNGLGFVGHYAPDSWFKKHSQQLQQELKRRLDAAQCP